MNERLQRLISGALADWKSRPGTLAVLLHGSVRTGRATDLSDVDIRVWVEGDRGLKEERTFVEGHPLHLIVFHIAWLDRQLTAEDPPAVDMVLRDEIMWEKDRVVSLRREQFSDYRPSSRAFASQRRAAKTLLVKATARHKQGDHAAAVLLGRLLGMAASEGFLIASGRLRPNPQWLVGMLGEMGDRRLAQACLEALGVAGATREDSERALARGAALVAELEAAAARLGSE